MSRAPLPAAGLRVNPVEFSRPSSWGFGGGRHYFVSTMVTLASNHTVGLERRMDTGFGASARESASGCGPHMEQPGLASGGVTLTLADAHAMGSAETERAPVIDTSRFFPFQVSTHPGTASCCYATLARQSWHGRTRARNLRAGCNLRPMALLRDAWASCHDTSAGRTSRRSTSGVSF
jgi:hypothetical protein